MACVMENSNECILQSPGSSMGNGGLEQKWQNRKFLTQVC